MLTCRALSTLAGHEDQLCFMLQIKLLGGGGGGDQFCWHPTGYRHDSPEIFLGGDPGGGGGCVCVNDRLIS